MGACGGANSVIPGGGGVAVAVDGLIILRSFDIGWSWGKEHFNQATLRDVGWEFEEFFNVIIEGLSAAGGDGVGYVGNGPGHVGKDTRTTGVAGFFFEFIEECDLEIIEIFIIAAERPGAAVFHGTVHYVPVSLVFVRIIDN